MSGILAAAQEAEIDRRAGIIAAQLVGQALHGAAERIAAAIVDGPVVVLPVLHLSDVARGDTGRSSGNATHITGTSA